MADPLMCKGNALLEGLMSDTWGLLRSDANRHLRTLFLIESNTAFECECRCTPVVECDIQRTPCRNGDICSWADINGILCQLLCSLGKGHRARHPAPVANLQISAILLYNPVNPHL